MSRIIWRSERWNFDVDRYVNRIVPASPLYRLPTSVSRFLGYRKEEKQDVGNVVGAAWSLVGAFCGLAVIAAVFNNTGSIQVHSPPALIASFVGSASSSFATTHMCVRPTGSLDSVYSFQIATTPPALYHIMF